MAVTKQLASYDIILVMVRINVCIILIRPKIHQMWRKMSIHWWMKNVEMIGEKVRYDHANLG